jgi:hypothetical protein
MLEAQELRKLRDNGVSLSQEALEKIAADDQFEEQAADDKLARISGYRKDHHARMTKFDSATETLAETMSIFIQASADYHQAYEAASAASRLLSGAGESAQRPSLLSGRQRQEEYEVRTLLADFRAAAARPL